MVTEYFEDVQIGTVREFGSKTVSKDEIIKFATKFDPQPFHIDEKAAADSIYEGIIASGWHTASLTMRMMVDHMVSSRAGLALPAGITLNGIFPYGLETPYVSDLKLLTKNALFLAQQWGPFLEPYRFSTKIQRW